ncbi:protease complex subunit PrcB family protein [Brevibacillus parabrevis]|uniref:protease complex subunit PrcB family protein n=1 Tax=Brevibacillus parabrevis TaxID=54914 RepID=UPI0030B836F5
MMNIFPSLLLAASLCVTGAQSVSLSHPTASAPAVKEVAPFAVEYEAVAAPYPPAVTEALKTVRKNGGHTVVRANGKAYVVISAGQRPTGGYRLVADQVKRTGPHGFTVHVRVQPPAPGALKTQAISYPTLVIALPDQQAQVKVQMR